MEKLKAQVLDANVKVKISNVHVRYEHFAGDAGGFAMGLLLRSMTVKRDGGGDADASTDVTEILVDETGAYCSTHSVEALASEDDATSGAKAGAARRLLPKQEAVIGRMRAEEAALRGRTAADAWLVPPVRIAGVMRHSGGEGGQPLSHFDARRPGHRRRLRPPARRAHPALGRAEAPQAPRRVPVAQAAEARRLRRGASARAHWQAAGRAVATQLGVKRPAAAARHARAEGALHVPHRPDGARVARRRGRRRRRARARRQGAHAPLGGARRAAQDGGLRCCAAARGGGCSA